VEWPVFLQQPRKRAWNMFDRPSSEAHATVCISLTAPCVASGVLYQKAGLGGAQVSRSHLHQAPVWSARFCVLCLVPAVALSASTPGSVVSFSR
jgi:hypothetical protein